MASVELNLRVNEGCGAQPQLLWDSVWDPRLGAADWAYATASETRNVGGLSARAAIETAVVLALFTDRRCPEGHPLEPYIDAGDRRGWWGDGIDVRADLGESEMGSLLWLLERATATPENANWARTFALDALQPLIAQGLAARADAQAELPSPGRINLAVQLYGRDGTTVYDRRFDDVWAQFTANGTI